MKDSITLNRTAPPPGFWAVMHTAKYSVFVGIDEKGKPSPPVRVEHDRQKFRLFLRRLEPGTEVAVEATGSWYWLVDELEAAGLVPHLAQPFAAKRMGGPGSKKTDGVDARALATLLHNGTLPETWIPSAEWRDLRNLMRTRSGVAPVSDLLEEPHCGGDQPLWVARAGGRRRSVSSPGTHEVGALLCQAEPAYARGCDPRMGAWWRNWKSRLRSWKGS